MKILARKKAVIEMFEPKIQNDGEGNKYTCNNCSQTFTTPPTTQNGKDYCSQKCANEAKQGNNE